MAKKFLATLAICASMSAHADMFYYNNVLIGDRAVGLGGAFTAVADDSSALAYNPAGLAFSLSKNISASMNAYNLKRTTYKNIIGTSSFTEHSDGLLPSFIGGLQRLDNVSDGLAVSLTIYSPDSEFKDQDDLITNPDLAIESFHRTINKRGSTIVAGIGAGKRLSANWGIGFGASFVNYDELVQEYQNAVSNLSLAMRTQGAPINVTAAAASKGDILQAQSSNQRVHLQMKGVEPSFGVQTMFFDKLSLGLSIRKTFIVSQDFELNGDSSLLFHFKDYSVVQASDLDPATADNIKNFVGSGKAMNTTPLGGISGFPNKQVSKEALDAWPAEVRIGTALFATTRMLWTFDVSHHFATTGGKGFESIYKREAVTNFSSGVEYYMTPSFPIRLGGFTNFDARPKLSGSKANQLDHIDYYGGSLFLVWAQTGSQLSLGTVAQLGSGKAQKIANSITTQEVDSFSTTVMFSASHNVE